jgi:hypothetical protein
MKISKNRFTMSEYADHALLKGSEYIAQPKGHATVGECPKRIGKCHILLIFGSTGTWLYPE